MFRLDVSATVLTGFVAGEEDDTTSFFRISLEHRDSSSWRDCALTPPAAESGLRLQGCSGLWQIVRLRDLELPLLVLRTGKAKVDPQKLRIEHSCHGSFLTHRVSIWSVLDETEYHVMDPKTSCHGPARACPSLRGRNS